MWKRQCNCKFNLNCNVDDWYKCTRPNKFVCSFNTDEQPHQTKNLTKKETIANLCFLATTIGENVFENKIPHDCFCGENEETEKDYLGGFQMDSEIIEYIKTAVREKIERNSK